MSTVFKPQKRTIILENVTHVQVRPDVTILYPPGYYALRFTGEEAEKAVALAIKAGFLGDNELLINPRRLIVAEEENATARLILDGAAKQLIVPVAFLKHLEATPVPVPAVSSDGKYETTSVPRAKKKSAQ